MPLLQIAAPVTVPQASKGTSLCSTDVCVSLDKHTPSRLCACSDVSTQSKLHAELTEVLWMRL